MDAGGETQESLEGRHRCVAPVGMALLRVNPTRGGRLGARGDRRVCGG